MLAVGTAESTANSEWTPQEKVALFDDGKATDQSVKCACMKRCSVSADKKTFICTDENTKPVGSKDVEMICEKCKVTKGTKNQCACKCGDNWGT